MSGRPMSELFAVLVDWSISKGAEMVDRLPGLWTGETAEWLVELNGQKTELEGIPPLTFKLTHKAYFLRMALVGPYGGALVGPSEDELIEYFRAEAQVAA
jgi:hypothetical protein